jgi:hypothetical protein
VPPASGRPASTAASLADRCSGRVPISTAPPRRGNRPGTIGGRREADGCASGERRGGAAAPSPDPTDGIRPGQRPERCGPERSGRSICASASIGSYALIGAGKAVLTTHSSSAGVLHRARFHELERGSHLRHDTRGCRRRTRPDCRGPAHHDVGSGEASGTGGWMLREGRPRAFVARAEELEAAREANCNLRPTLEVGEEVEAPTSVFPPMGARDLRRAKPP